MGMLRAIRRELPEIWTVYGGVSRRTMDRRSWPRSARSISLCAGRGGDGGAVGDGIRAGATFGTSLTGACLGQGRVPSRRPQSWSFDPEGRVVVNPQAPVIRDLDAYRVGWDLIDFRRYTYYGKRRAVVVQFSRGCPRRCHSVGQHAFWRTWRHRDPVRLAKELAQLHREHGVELINFADENPTASRAAWKAFLEALVAENVPLVMIGTTRAGDIVRDADLLPLYGRAGGAVSPRLGKHG